jgi:hypothetical protein
MIDLSDDSKLIEFALNNKDLIRRLMYENDQKVKRDNLLKSIEDEFADLWRLYYSLEITLSDAMDDILNWDSFISEENLDDDTLRVINLAKTYQMIVESNMSYDEIMLEKLKNG